MPGFSGTGLEPTGLIMKGPSELSIAPSIVNAAGSRELTLQQRIDAQQAIDRVCYSHQVNGP